MLPRTERITLRSQRVEQTYVLYVSLPRDYAAREDRFAVAYLLDADYSFPVVRAVVEHLSDRAELRELILIGVAYPKGLEGADWRYRYRSQRTRDYTPTHSSEGYPAPIQQHSGGADAFLGFLEHELVPFVDGRYRTVHGDRTLVGHSYGGLFGAYAVLTSPGLFSAAILVSPSLWYDDGFLFDYEKRRRGALTSLPLDLFLAVGEREVSSRRDMVRDTERFGKQLQDAGYARLKVRTRTLPDEGHDTVFPAAVSVGLRELLAK